MPWWQQSFFQVALPIVLAQLLGIVVLVFGFLNQNKRLDDIIARLGRIEDLLREHDRRITTLEERTSPLRR